MSDFQDQDPVCGADLDRLRARASSEYAGVRFYFCSESCKEEFERNPSRYLVAEVIRAPAD